jgi:hypothetical protein
MPALRMIAIRVGWSLLFVTILTAQQASAPNSPKSESAEPNLPVINYDACPGKNRKVPRWKIKRKAPIYSSWNLRRVVTGTAKPGEEVTVLAGVTVTRKPDRVSVIRPMPDLSLKPGDTFLRYDTFGEGDANIWVNGIWHKDINMWRTTEKNGTGCGNSDCDSIVVANGMRERWVRVKSAAGAIGWMQGSKSTGDTFWDSGNFDSLCAG